MGDDLPIINYKGPTQKKHLDATTLSRIRSHAQQAVQDQKWVDRANKAEAKAARQAERASREAAKRHPAHGMQFIFETKSGREVKRAVQRKRKGNRAMEREKESPLTDDEAGLEVVQRESHSLSASPAERPDPFGSFPVEINAEFMNLFYGYYQSWKWASQPPELLFRENMCHPVLAHSFLAMANTVWRDDARQRALHENQTFVAVHDGLPQLSTLSGIERSDLACALTWAIIRLATIKVNQGQLETSLQHLNALHFIPWEDWQNSRFATHFQSAIASLLLANFSQLGQVKPLLHLPFGPLTSWAVDDVLAQGFHVPRGTLMYHTCIQENLQPRISDAILGLTALYNICNSDGDDKKDDSLPHVHSGLRASSAVKIALRLAKHSTPLSSPLDCQWDWLAEFQECVRLTALLFTWTFGRKLINRSDAIFSAQRYTRAFLTPRLLHRTLGETGGDQAMVDLFTWILIVCGSASFTDEDREYFVDLIRVFIPRAKNARYAEIRQIGMRMPWIETPNRSPAEEFWELVSCERDVVNLEESVEGGTSAGPMLLGFVSVGRTPMVSPLPIRERVVFGGEER